MAAGTKKTVTTRRDEAGNLTADIVEVPLDIEARIRALEARPDPTTRENMKGLVELIADIWVDYFNDAAKPRLEALESAVAALQKQAEAVQ